MHSVCSDGDGDGSLRPPECEEADREGGIMSINGISALQDALAATLILAAIQGAGCYR